MAFLLSCTVLMALPFPSFAQSFSGNDTTSGTFSNGNQHFRNSSTLDASAANAVSGGKPLHG